MKGPPDWRNVPRLHLAYLPKETVRKFLETPIRANRIRPGDDRERMIKQETAARKKALFALYNIPDDWDEILQWRELALCLAGEFFAGCKTLREGRGGPSKSTIKAKNAEKLSLLAEFDEFWNSRSNFTENAAAIAFLKQNRARCAAAKLTKPRSFAQAMRRIREKTRTETPA